MSDPAEDPYSRGDAVELTLDAIRQALIEGEESGEPDTFDFAAFKQRKVGEFDARV